jgi:predicted nucleotidyltransferase
VSLLRDVVAVLETAHIRYALIGAAAMAVHGVSRATADIDLLTVETRSLRDELWAELKTNGAALRILKGDYDDPLAGSVRLRSEAQIVDVVVGRYVWQREILDDAERRSIGEVELPVARPAGLVLLKLHAGGPKDAWDIRSLLESHAAPDAIRADVDQVIPRLSADSRQLWEKLRTGS